MTVPGLIGSLDFKNYHLEIFCFPGVANIFCLVCDLQKRYKDFVIRKLKTGI
jgi:hypothetical protein